MLEIKKQRELTVHDFIKNKDYYPFKNWRFTAKQINFSLLFGCSAMRFAVMLENSGYTESEAMEYIQQTNNLPMFNTEVIKQQGKMSKKKVAYLVAATLMREAYFNSYQGLATRIAREQEYGRRHGYVRTWHGPENQQVQIKSFIHKSSLICTMMLVTQLYSHLNQESLSQLGMKLIST